MRWTFARRVVAGCLLTTWLAGSAHADWWGRAAAQVRGDKPKKNPFVIDHKDVEREMKGAKEYGDRNMKPINNAIKPAVEASHKLGHQIERAAPSPDKIREIIKPSPILVNGSHGPNLGHVGLMASKLGQEAAKKAERDARMMIDELRKLGQGGKPASGGGGKPANPNTPPPQQVGTLGVDTSGQSQNQPPKSIDPKTVPDVKVSPSANPSPGTIGVEGAGLRLNGGKPTQPVAKPSGTLPNGAKPTGPTAVAGKPPTTQSPTGTIKVNPTPGKPVDPAHPTTKPSTTTPPVKPGSTPTTVKPPAINPTTHPTPGSKPQPVSGTQPPRPNTPTQNPATADAARQRLEQAQQRLQPQPTQPKPKVIPPTVAPLTPQPAAQPWQRVMGDLAGMLGGNQSTSQAAGQRLANDFLGIFSPKPSAPQPAPAPKPGPQQKKG